MPSDNQLDPGHDNLEARCAEFVARVDFLERLEPHGTLPTKYSFRPDAVSKGFAKYLKRTATHPKISSRSDGQAFRQKWINVWKNVDSLRSFFSFRVPAPPSKSSNRSRVFLSCHLQHPKFREWDTTLTDFFVRRGSVIKALQNAGLDVCVVVVHYEPSPRKMDVSLLNQASKKFGCKFQFVSTQRLSVGSRLWYLASTLRICLRNTLRMLTTTERGSDWFRLRDIGYFCYLNSVLQFAYLKCLRSVLLNDLFVSGDYYITSYSFLREDRIFVSAMQAKGGCAIDLAPRIYSLSRPSNCTDMLRNHPNEMTLPRYFVVPCKGSMATLEAQGVNRSNIFLRQGKDPTGDSNFPAFSEDADAVLLYLQRLIDQPLKIIEEIHRNPRTAGCRIYCKPHPRFPEVRAFLEEHFKGKSKLCFLENESEIDEPLGFACAVFSTAAIRAFNHGIPVVWLPFLNDDSRTVLKTIAEHGVVVQSWDDFHEILETQQINEFRSDDQPTSVGQTQEIRLASGDHKLNSIIRICVNSS